MADPIFLPWIRRGLAQGIGGPDPLSGPLPTNPEVVASVEIADDTGNSILAEQPHRLAGPGDVAAVEATTFLRFEPPEGTADFESNYFPFIELLSPDLPWLLTPAAATAEAALRPWLVLVVVEERDGVVFDPSPANGTPVLSIDAEMVHEELWDLADSHAWVHAHASVATGDIENSVEAGDGLVIARLICPRQLLPGRTYRGAVVPAFDLGVRAGLGDDTSEATSLEPAWDIDDAEPVALPVYASWTFATSDLAADFESLCLRLEPDSSGARLGYRAAVLDHGGLLPPPEPSATDFEYGGALVDPLSTGQGLGSTAKTWFTNGLTPHLDRAEGRQELPPIPSDGYKPERDDPVVGPPNYGSHASELYNVTPRGWQRSVNLDVQYRAAAGVGAELVRTGQHDFLAAAWDQVGALRPVVSELNTSRLSAELSNRHLEKLVQLDDATLLFATGSAKAFVPVDDGTAAGALAASSVVPTGLVSSTFFRAARGSGSVGRSLEADRDSLSLAARVTNTFIASSDGQLDTNELDAVTSFTSAFVPQGTFTATTVLDDPGVASSIGTAVQIIPSRHTSSLLSRSRFAGPSAILPPAMPTLAASNDVTLVAKAVRLELKPAQSVAFGLAERLTGLDIDIMVPIPTRLVVGPWFPDGLADRLQQLSVDYLLPGVESVEMDRVRLLEVNEKFVESFLIGANHEWAREALWREFPADLGATVFASLFDRPGDPPAPGPDTDLDRDIHLWNQREPLASHVGSAGTSTVVLIRAELVRRYPGLVVTLLKPLAGEVPIGTDDVLIPEHVTDPSFVGSIDDKTIFVGFPVDPDVVLGDDWYISIEEPPSGPRFGLDFASGSESGTPPGEWDDLTWGHVEAAGNTASHIRFETLAWDGITNQDWTWARNSAHQAGITFQQPFRMIFPAATLLGGTS